MANARYLRIMLVAGLLLALVALPAATAEKELRFLTIGYSQALRDLISETIAPPFENEHGVKIVMESAGWGDRVDRLTILVAAGTPPDIVSTGFYSPYEEGGLGVLAPLDQYLARWDKTHTIPQGLWDTQSWDGSVYVVPQYFDIRGIVYNKTTFEESGLDPQATPKSWEELVDFTRRLTRLSGDGNVSQRGMELGGNQAQNLMWWMLQTPAPPVEASNFRSNLNRPEALQAVENMVEVTRAAHRGTPGPGGGNNILMGNTAMGIASPGTFGGFARGDFPELINDLGVFAPQQFINSDPVAIAFINGLAIPATAANKDLAWEFIAHLMSDEVQLLVTEVTGWVSPRADMARDLMFEPGIHHFYNVIQYLRAPVIPPPRNIAQQEVSGLLDQVLNQQMSPQEALLRGHELWTRLLGEWRQSLGR